MPGRIKPLLAQIWHAPDRIRLMDPLPPAHRRGIILCAILIVLCFLWPSPDEPNTPQRRDAELDFNRTPEPPVQPQAVSPAETPEANVQQPASGAPVQPFQNNDIEQQWRTYRVESGKTLAQLFRDHNLPPEDVYAMAKVEGDGKPLSNLQQGQMVQVRQNASGVVTALTIDTGDNQQVLFTRQPDGSFLRVR
ncbi:cell envelope opacity-associated protein A [Cronobacter muytjensii]|nr:cell envelope opacity-associated protein A [Cronobacter muytjensii]